jgi:short-subunit dehydrogenase
MKLNDKKIILTGAYGAIASEVAHLLLSLGAHISLVGRNEQSLNDLEKTLASSVKDSRNRMITIVADIAQEDDRRKIIDKTLSNFGQVDVLINLAGLMSFNQFSEEDPKLTEELFQVNVLAPMHLTKMIIPHMLEKDSGQIINVGSTFGSIAFAWFATYSATKFALRGFSEALRRELDSTGVEVSYIAPRAVKTPFNSDAITQMLKHSKAKIDDPSKVAKDIINAIQGNVKEKYLGFPESIFVRINSLFPRVVDKALKKQNRDAKKFTKK